MAGRVSCMHFFLNVLCLCILLSACNSSSSSTSSSSNSSSNPSSSNTELNLSPPFQYVPFGSSYQFVASGGSSPYLFSVSESTFGSISSSGLFTASPTNAGIVIVQVTDSLGNYRVSNVLVDSAFNLTPSSNTVFSTQTKQLKAAGGIAPYSYSIFSGLGSVSNTGLFSSIWQIGTSIVRATDSVGNVSDSVMNVLPSSRQFGTIGKNDFASAIVLDGSGYIYMSGSTYSTYLNGQTNAGGMDGYLVKMDPAGNLQWTITLGSSGDDSVTALALDGSRGNVIVVGSTIGNMGSNLSLGGTDLFVARFDSRGTRIWLEQFGTSGNDSANAVTIDHSGFIYVSGTTDGSFDSNSNQGGTDAFLLKLNSSGTKVWVKQIGTADDDTGNALTVDSSDEVYLAGTTQGRMNGQANSGDSLNPSVGYTDIFVAKYDGSGNQQWTLQRGSMSSNTVGGIAIDSSNHIFVTGSTNGSLDENPYSGSANGYLMSCSSSGSLRFIRQFSGFGAVMGNAISIDAQNIVYVTGSAVGNFSNLTNAGNLDLFLKAFDSSGESQWTQLVGTSSDESGLAVSARSPYGIFVAGYSRSDQPLDPLNTSQEGPNLLLKFNSSGVRQ